MRGESVEAPPCRGDGLDFVPQCAEAGDHLTHRETGPIAKGPLINNIASGVEMSQLHHGFRQAIDRLIWE